MPVSQPKATFLGTWMAFTSLLVLALGGLRYREEGLSLAAIFLWSTGLLLTSCLLLAWLVHKGFLFGWAGAFLAAVAYLFWLMGESLAITCGLPDWTPPLAVLAFLLLLLGALYWLVCSAILANLPERLQFRTADPETLPAALDHEGLEERTRELEALGFTLEMDYSVDPKLRQALFGFGRLLAHQQHRCFGVIAQTFPAQGPPSPLRWGIVSYLEDNWRLATSSERSSLLSVVHLPRDLGMNLPGLTVAELLRAHLERRQEMMKDLHIAPIPDLTPAAYFEGIRKSLMETRVAMKRRVLLFLIWQWWRVSKLPRYEWLGDYARVRSEQRPLE
jgi:hypothetical protein